MERPWDSKSAILHADLDCFFAAVEILDDPSLAGKPVIVGGTGGRGVVAAASYEARVWGVRSAMPMVTARRACPKGIFLSGRYSRYAAISQRFHTVLSSITDEFEPIGLDEAFLDVGGARRLFGSPPTIASEIRRRVKEELDLSVCVGVGTTKQIAKLASRRAKPSVSGRVVRPGKGIEVVWPGQEVVFLTPLSVGELWGVGPKSLELLRKMGVATIGDLRRASDSRLRAAFGARGAKLKELAEGIDTDPVIAHASAKSISHEETYASDLYGLSQITHEVSFLADSLASRAEAKGLIGRTITLKIRFSDFRTVTRSVTLDVPTRSRKVLLDRLRALIPPLSAVDGVRLLGASLSQLSDNRSVQLSLLDYRFDERSEALEKTVNDIKRRFGEGSLLPASLLEGRHRPGDSSDPPMWGPSE